MKLYDQQEYKNCMLQPTRCCSGWQAQVLGNANLDLLTTKVVQMIRMKNGTSSEPPKKHVFPSNEEKTNSAVPTLAFAESFTIPVPLCCNRVEGTEYRGKWEFEWEYTDVSCAKKSMVELYRGDYSGLMTALKDRAMLKDESGKTCIDVVVSDVMWGIFEGRPEDRCPEPEKQVCDFLPVNEKKDLHILLYRLCDVCSSKPSSMNWQRLTDAASFLR